MFISPPFLPTRTQPQADETWLAAAMVGGDQVNNGSFPVGQLNAWHGGLHLRAPAGNQGNLPVCAIADGTVAYRRNPVTERTPSHALNYHGSADDLMWTDNGVVVLRHTLELGPGDLSAVVVYSVYMHLVSLHRELPAIGQPVTRGTPLGNAGSVAGVQGLLHFEIVAAPDQIARLCGRETRLLDTANNGRTAVIGTVYARLPVGTEWKTQVSFPAANDNSISPQGVPGAAVAHTSTEVLYVGLVYENARCVSTLYNERGEAVATRTEAEAHYTLYDTSAARFPDSPQAGYELMRYGRTMGQQALTPADAPHWRQIPIPGGGTGWVNLRGDAVRWFSDSDFPHWRGWQLVADDADTDVRINSAIVEELRRGGAPAPGAPSLTAQQGEGNLESLRRLACLFPTEWAEEDATIEERYGWIKTLPAASGSPNENFEKFAAYIKAQGFWTAAALADLPARHWHLNPRALIELLRGPQMWPELANSWQTALEAHGLPVDDGLSANAKAALYEYALRSSKAAVRSHTDAVTTAPLAALDSGRPVIFGMRVQTDINANNGRGLWDDRLVVLKKESTALTEVAYRGPYTSEPSGRYLDGGEFQSSTNGSNVNVGGTPHFDSGRLIAQRSYEYQGAYSNGFGPNIAGTNFNILRKTQSSFVERLVTTAAQLPPNVHVSGANTRWITGTTAGFGELQTMHFHRGYNGMTGSAGCQTFPVAAGQTFMDFVRPLSPIAANSRFQYVLRGM
jgi:hypothetical protein